MTDFVVSLQTAVNAGLMLSSLGQFERVGSGKFWRASLFRRRNATTATYSQGEGATAGAAIREAAGRAGVAIAPPPVSVEDLL